jgi:hypothetical protein
MIPRTKQGEPADVNNTVPNNAAHTIFSVDNCTFIWPCVSSAYFVTISDPFHAFFVV